MVRGLADVAGEQISYLYMADIGDLGMEEEDGEQLFAEFHKLLYKNRVLPPVPGAIMAWPPIGNGETEFQAPPLYSSIGKIN